METLFDPISNDQEGLSQRIAAELRRRILAGEYKPGTRVRQEELAESFGTSRIPVREALWQLETEGLVVLIRNTGAWIAKLDLADCVEVYKIRERIEPLALAESIVNLKDSEIASLNQIVTEIERDLEVLSAATSPTAASASPLDSFLRRDREFHLLCYRAAKMPRLTSMIERFWNTTQQYRRANSSVMGPSGHKIVAYEHRLLLDAITRRDVETAAHVLADHIRRTRLHLQEHKELF
jgi:DNA-binding GntR family transcriptional regulator